ncbi:hypothetical protein O6H91_17G071700 [Diphasiastrum complanatum]|uniref:Uncharacterized protein n=1 Tax=Diphasiastrum complanatum TaxID=34168 RepID=A0ACC2B804_DIPCM|nr:hypothetical protein O6H91_17G071700 [Diphasiastrum complanatum]
MNMFTSSLNSVFSDFSLNCYSAAKFSQLLLPRCKKSESYNSFTSSLFTPVVQQNPCQHLSLTSSRLHSIAAACIISSFCSHKIKYRRSFHGCCAKGTNSRNLKQKDDEDEDEDEDVGIELETLNLLEWPLICSQVASFASTPMGIAAARNAQILIGTSQQESEQLLAQTAAVLSLSCRLDFSGIRDITHIVRKALSDEICSLSDFCVLRNALTAAQKLADQILQPFKLKAADHDGSSDRMEVERCSPLRSIMTNCDLCSELRQELERCVDCRLEIVLDRASQALEAVRKSRQDNMKTLEALLKMIATRVMEAGGMDSAIVTKRRGRLCVAVKTTHKHLVPGGAVLDVSNTGATVFVEPQPALELNNMETVLSMREQDEEEAALRILTANLVPMAESVLKLCECVTCLDLACARAAHAKWLGAVRPTFSPLADSTKYMIRGARRDGVGHKALEDTFLIFMQGVRHPLLLGTALSKARQDSFTQSIDDRECNALQANLPVPIDVKVKSKVKGVILSGPNTGGKTATLKTIGAAVLMSKAGLYIPAEGSPTLPWFTRVLAHIGDNQSLQQNLSTFSGRIKQLCKIIHSGDPGALVLLDELGGGTDPSEGAALATAVLKHIVQSVRLTVATTHCMELKDLGIQDSSLENASVEFDTRTLRPTYRVLWGQAGPSNALDIASSLNFDPAVLNKAQRLLIKLAPDALRARQSELTIHLLQQLKEEQDRAKVAAAKLFQIQKLYSEIALESSNLDMRMEALKYQNQTAITDEIAEAELRINEIVSEFQNSHDGGAGIAETHTLHNAEVAIASILKEYSEKYEAMLPNRDKESDKAVLRLPQLGDKVLAKTLGRKPGIVVKSPRTSTDYLTVQIGSLNIHMKLSEVIVIPS